MNSSSDTKNKEKEALYKRLKALKALAVDPGATEAEKINALGKIKTILAKYSILESEINEEIPVKNIILSIDPVYWNEWPHFMMASIGDFYNCKILFAGGERIPNGDIGKHKQVMIFGSEEDIAASHQVIKMLLEQSAIRSDELYNWACEQFGKSPYNVPMVMSYDTIWTSTSTINTGFGSFSDLFSMGGTGGLNSPQNLINMRTLLMQFTEMPPQKSFEWADIEQDWGMGLSLSVIQRLSMLNKYAAEQEAAEENNNHIRISASQQSSNALVVSANSLILQQQEYHDKRIDEIDAYVKNIFADGINDQRKNNVKIKNPFLFQQGQNEGATVEIVDKKKTTSKKHKDRK